MKLSVYSQRADFDLTGVLQASEFPLKETKIKCNHYITLKNLLLSRVRTGDKENVELTKSGTV